MASFRAALLVLAACLCLSTVSAQNVVYQMNVTSLSGQAIGAGYRIFAGASDTLVVTHSAPLLTGDGTTVTLTCVTDTMLTGTAAGFTITQPTQCLSQNSVSFTLTAGPKAVGALSNSPTCTFTVQGLNATVFAVPTLGAIEIRAPQMLTVPKALQRATDFNNPLNVFATSIDYTYLAGAEAPAVGTVQLVPTCVSHTYTARRTVFSFLSLLACSAVLRRLRCFPNLRCLLLLTLCCLPCVFCCVCVFRRPSPL